MTGASYGCTLPADHCPFNWPEGLTSGNGQYLLQQWATVDLPKQYSSLFSFVLLRIFMIIYKVLVRQ